MHRCAKKTEEDGEKGASTTVSKPLLGMGKLDLAWLVERIMLSAFARVTNLVAFGYTGATIACVISNFSW